MADSEHALVSSPAKALVQEFRKPRPFLVRLGIGMGRATNDAHASINNWLWHSGKADEAPNGVILTIGGSIATSIITAIGCGFMSLVTGLTFAQLAFTWPALVLALLPAEFVASNVAINILFSLPSVLKWAGNNIIAACLFIKEQVEIRIPDE